MYRKLIHVCIPSRNTLHSYSHTCIHMPSHTCADFFSSTSLLAASASCRHFSKSFSRSGSPVAYLHSMTSRYNMIHGACVNRLNGRNDQHVMSAPLFAPLEHHFRAVILAVGHILQSECEEELRLHFIDQRGSIRVWLRLAQRAQTLSRFSLSRYSWV